MGSSKRQVSSITPTVEKRIADELENTVEIARALICEMETALEAMHQGLAGFEGGGDELMVFELQSYALKSKAERLVLSAHFAAKLMTIQDKDGGNKG